MTPEIKNTFKNYLYELQAQITDALSDVDGKPFIPDNWERKIDDGTVTGKGSTQVLKKGAIIEQGGVNVSVVHGNELPGSASDNKPHLAGKPFEAMGLSLVIHPQNPFVPTTHANIRLIIVKAPEDSEKIIDWWFGGGFDLTPYYVFEEDVIHWHQTARQACQPFGDDIYPKFKAWCDEYFYLKHRKETRGVGGLFFDDFNHLPVEEAMAMAQSIGSAFLPAYLPILNQRKDTPYTDYERDFQAYRRGRYVEFNLVYDRGTFFGLKSGFRVESILMSMPPRVHFEYDYQPQNLREQELVNYLKPRNWLEGLDELCKKAPFWDSKRRLFR